MLAPYTNNPNAPSPKGWTPLYWAAKYGYIDVAEALVTELVKRGIKDLNVPDYLGRTPLQAAMDLTEEPTRAKIIGILSNTIIVFE